MYFDSFADFLAMGRHGLYVWLSYGFFLLILVWNLVLPWLARRQALARARDYWNRTRHHSSAEVSHETH